MEKKQVKTEGKGKIKWAATCGLLACLGEFLVEFHAANGVPGYNAVRQTISYLGHADSPMHTLVTFWGTCFTLLFLGYAHGFQKVYQGFPKAKWAVMSMVVHGLAQGMGSAYFPVDLSQPVPLGYWDLHQILSGCGDLALVGFPWVMQGYFKDRGAWGLYLTRWVGYLGAILMLLFVVSKYGGEGFLGPYKGLLQRLAQGVYYVYFCFLAMGMLRGKELPFGSR
ncbi:DUF998 domain-containing protein [Flagellimonas beolgyonensis]|uniref:DUF998 domain-containing protein n=1 Tax=Flagellimonas beolgyonensis TaxID=864064 RepID=UPI003D648D38